MEGLESAKLHSLVFRGCCDGWSAQEVEPVTTPTTPFYLVPPTTLPSEVWGRVLEFYLRKNASAKVNLKSLVSLATTSQAVNLAVDTHSFWKQLALKKFKLDRDNLKKPQRNSSRPSSGGGRRKRRRWKPAVFV
jgi:hypothetical protein